MSRLRDGEGMVEHMDKLAAEGRLGGLEPLRAHLRSRPATGPHAARDLAAFRVEFLALGERARIWALYGDGLRPMQRGLERSFERARKGRATADRPRIAAIHDWRKRITYHWDHTGLLRPMERGPESRKLSERLSDHHDLTMLDSNVAASPDIPDGPELRAALQARIAARQAERTGAAQSLGTFRQPGRGSGPKLETPVEILAAEREAPGPEAPEAETPSPSSPGRARPRSAAPFHRRRKAR